MQNTTAPVQLPAVSAEATWTFPESGAATPETPPTASNDVPVSTPVPVPNPASPPTIQFGTVNFGIIADPACGFDAVNVTVTKVRFHMSAAAAASDAGWTEITLKPALRIDLTKMNNGALAPLATAVMTPGQYAQARLVLDPNSGNGLNNSVVVGGIEKPLVTQTVNNNGILLDQSFALANGQTLNLVANFDACRSVLPNHGQYLLRPYLKSVQSAKNGIIGYVNPALLGSHARVTAQQAGVIIRAAIPDPVTGEFFLSRMNRGNYDVVVTADGRATTVITDVAVASDVSVTQLSSPVLPISLAAATTGSISAVAVLTPASTTEAAFVSASQTYDGVRKLTLAYRMADLATGQVTINELPVVAAQRSAYQLNVPFSFLAVTDVLPGLGWYKVAASAPGYVTSLSPSLQAVPAN